jgi:ABC-type amino acid transport substrate-binding protein
MKVMQRNLAATLLLLAALPAGAGTALDAIAKRGSIVIANREYSVPFSFLNENKQPVGYAIDICKSIAEAVRVKLKLQTLPIQYLTVTAANRIPTIVEGKADLECGSTSNTAERRKTVAFSIPYFVTGASFLVPSTSKVKELMDFHDQRLVSTTGTTPLKEVTRLNREEDLRIKILEAADHEQAVRMVEQSQADGFVMDDVLLYALRAGRPDPSKLKVVGRMFGMETLAVMMPNTDPDLKAIADSEMLRLINTRRIFSMYDHWFLEPSGPKGVALNLPLGRVLKELWTFPVSDWSPK